ncbi:hypothetical protein [Amycolatopsis regifaucium]|uniref:Uncharacterized protein n=1 Tax=Amycolatopsis regifaucium TaxID=546365 RepID=A0A154MWY7_9PSEU|nr:hypothetical protein [Amycolatopsis regifaucium]KZB88257.1 hypothetical protein AVL48_20075 [Amycolatopsis regifaucium]OKA11372.1 hypothetical protein ATP06_0200460 [Amycolatopsis regifaucium]SFH43509.1 hypothetical protein SAMN04489731_104171 [Amycolatopsis regifaucium]
MSGFAKWTLGIGILLMVAAVVCSMRDLIPASVITGIVGLIGLTMAGYDVIHDWSERAELRRRGEKAAASGRDREQNG